MMKMVLRCRHAVIKRTEEHKTLDLGSLLCVTETRAPIGRVDGYYFVGSAIKPDFYIVKLDSGIQVPKSTPISYLEDFAQHVDDDELYKRYHDPNIKQPECLETQFRSNQSAEQSRVPQENLNQTFSLQQQQQTCPNATAPMMYQQDMRPPYCNAPAPMVYQQQNIMSPETYQLNQMGIVPDQALTMIMSNLMMNLQQYFSGQIWTILQGGGLGSYGVNLNCFNPQTQHQGFNIGPSSYRGRGGHRGRARGRGRGRRARERGRRA